MHVSAYSLPVVLPVVLGVQQVLTFYSMSRYALAILDNPKLEAMWPFQQNLSISEGGIMVHLNPFLCPSRISPLVNDVLKWNKNDSKRSIDISDTTNGNAMACKYREEPRDRVHNNIKDFSLNLSMLCFSCLMKKPTMLLISVTLHPHQHTTQKLHSMDCFQSLK